MPERSRRLGEMEQSEIRWMTRECARVSGINLGQGVCDTPTPPFVAEAARAAIAAGRCQYSLPEGTRELREAIAADLARREGIEADPEREIVVCAGASGAYAGVVFGLLDPGDGILLPEPFYGYHRHEAELAGLEVQPVRTAAPRFALEEGALRAALRPNSRALVLCTPANPSGHMLGERELAAVAAAARERDLLIVTDEIYQHFVYDGRRHLAPAAFEDLAARTVSIRGFSKVFSVTGWRLGYAFAPERLARPLVAVNDVYFVCAPTPLQFGAAAGLARGDAHYAALARDHQRRRDALCAALREAGAAPVAPDGAYYVLADVSAWGKGTARVAALDLLERAGVASIPGTAFWFGAEGERWLRFCFGKKDEVVDEACRRIASYRP